MSLVVYGVNCVWWDSIDNVARHPRNLLVDMDGEGPGLPCCPFCHSVLMQQEDNEWWEGVRKHVHPRIENYAKFVAWLKGKCFKKMDYAMDAYLKEQE